MSLLNYIIAKGKRVIFSFKTDVAAQALMRQLAESGRTAPAPEPVPEPPVSKWPTAPATDPESKRATTPAPKPKPKLKRLPRPMSRPKRRKP